MNVAIINTLAKTGSTGKIAYAFQQYLKSLGHNAYVFYGRPDEQVTAAEKDIIRIGNNFEWKTHAFLSRITGMQGIYSHAASMKMLKTFDELEIQAVCMFNLHGYYLNFPMLFEYRGKKKLPCEYVMLDEYPFLGKCAYSFDCDKFITECKNCQHLEDYPKSLWIDNSTKMFCIKREAYKLAPQCTFVGTAYTVERAKRSAITKNCKFGIADEAIDLKNVYYPRDTSRLRKELKISARKKVVVTVTPYPNERKGGKYFLEAAKRLESNEEIVFVHVGFEANVSECPSNYIPIRYVKNQNLLAEYYSLGDLFVHTSIAETIPAAILEALACGTPIMGFNSSGIPYSADAEHGVFVEPRNVDKMVEIIEQVPQKDEDRIQSCRKYAESRYNSLDYGRKLLDFLK